MKITRKNYDNLTKKYIHAHEKFKLGIDNCLLLEEQFIKIQEEYKDLLKEIAKKNPNIFSEYN